MIGSAPAMGLYLTSYEASKNSLQRCEVFRESPSLSYLAAGMAAQASSSVLWLPIDVIKQRMQVQTRSPIGGATGVHTHVYYRSTGHAMQTIIRTEGLGGLYRGFAASMLSFGPYSALYFMFYEKVRKRRVTCADWVCA